MMIVINKNEYNIFSNKYMQTLDSYKMYIQCSMVINLWQILKKSVKKLRKEIYTRYVY